MGILSCWPKRLTSPVEMLIVEVPTNNFLILFLYILYITATIISTALKENHHPFFCKDKNLIVITFTDQKLWCAQDVREACFSNPRRTDHLV